MVLFQGILGKVMSRKDKTYSIQFDTQELSSKEAGDILENLQEFVNLLIIPYNPKLVEKIVKILKENG